MQTIPFLSQHNKPLNKEAKHLEKRHVIKPNVKMNEQFFISSPFFNIIVQLQCISIEAVRLFKKKHSAQSHNLPAKRGNKIAQTPNCKHMLITIGRLGKEVKNKYVERTRLWIKFSQ